MQIFFVVRNGGKAEGKFYAISQRAVLKALKLLQVKAGLLNNVYHLC